MHTESIKLAIQNLHERLGAGLTEIDRIDGWTDQAAAAMQLLLNNMSNSITKQTPMKALSIARGLDHWGVERGELLEAFAALSNAYQKWAESMSE